MAAAIKLGQILKGNLSTYTITKELYRAGVWLAKNEADQKVIIKGFRSDFPARNEREILTRFQAKAPLRPLIDDIQGFDCEPPLVLQYYDDDLLKACTAKKLSSPEVKFVAKNILQALDVLHSNGYVHTDVKPSNILANYGEGAERFSDVVLADFEQTYHKDSKIAKDGGEIGTAIFRSPEASWPGIRWNTSTDIWAFGATLISLFYGDFHIFLPNVSVDDPQYSIEVSRRHVKYFGPYAACYVGMADDKALEGMIGIMESMPTKSQHPFAYVTEKEVAKEDREFLVKIMKMDPNARPTAAELLQDEWLEGV